MNDATTLVLACTRYQVSSINEITAAKRIFVLNVFYVNFWRLSMRQKILLRAVKNMFFWELLPFTFKFDMFKQNLKLG